jgi:hypothetical protein
VTFQKVNGDFPIFVWKNFEVLEDFKKNELMTIVLDNKKKNHTIGPGTGGGSFKITEGSIEFFETLYSKFFNSAIEFFGNLKILPDNSKMCWSYSSNNADYGPGAIHNHIRTSTINSVYYLNVPNSATEDNGSIQFFLKDQTFSYRPNNFDLVMFPNYLDHKINYLNDSEYRISINMEINCEENAEELFKK